MSEQVNSPKHYEGADNPYEAIKVIEAWNLGFCLGNTIKYILRAGKKNQDKTIEDLEKARWYLDREIQKLKSKLVELCENCEDVEFCSNQCWCLKDCRQ